MEYSKMINLLYDELILNINSKVRRDEQLKNHTYFKIGGPVDLFIEPEDINELTEIFNLIRL